MVKKRLLLSVASLVLLGGIGYGTYASVQQQPTTVKHASEQSTQSKKSRTRRSSSTPNRLQKRRLLRLRLKRRSILSLLSRHNLKKPIRLVSLNKPVLLKKNNRQVRQLNKRQPHSQQRLLHQQHVNQQAVR